MNDVLSCTSLLFRRVDSCVVQNVKELLNRQELFYFFLIRGATQYSAGRMSPEGNHFLKLVSLRHHYPVGNVVELLLSFFFAFEKR